jgi:uroporphyrinogen decarboxylase
MKQSRQRMLDAFNYNRPDKVPVVYHPSKAGLYIHGQKLIDLFNKYPPDNPIIFNDIPEPGKEAFGMDGEYHEIITDEWGVGWEYRIFGIAGHPKTYPFRSWGDAVRNYQFPEIPVLGTPEFYTEKDKTKELKNEFLIFNGWISIFEKLHALRPFEEVLMDIAIQDENLLAFIEKLTEYWERVIKYYISTGTDVFVFGDDWGTQDSTLISPESFREIFKPHYKKLFLQIQKAGGLVFLHCCGFLGELLDEFIEMGIRGLWPQINLFEKDKTFALKCRENKIAIYIHPDRQQLIPLGKPEQIDTFIRLAAEKYKELGGGGIFYVEIENDAPFENVKALIEAIHRYR